MTLTKQQVDNLPLGFTPTGYASRKERRSKEYQDKLKMFHEKMTLKLADQVKSGEEPTRPAIELLNEL